MQTFAEYCKNRRERDVVTQQRLAEELSRFDDAFSDIDAGTIYRWEKGRNEPGLYRKRLFIQYFGDDEIEILPFKPRQKIEKPLIGDILNYIRSRIRIDDLHRLIGDFASSSDLLDYKFTRFSSANENNGIFDVIFDFDKNLCDDPPAVSIEKLLEWDSFDSNICLVCTRSCNYFGHLIAIRIKDSTFEQIVHGEIQEGTIGSHVFVDCKESGSLYLYSMHAHSQMIGALFLSIIIQYLIANRETTLKVGGLCTNRDEYRLARRVGLVPVCMGPYDSGSKINLNGRTVKWVFCAGNVGRVLESRDYIHLGSANTELGILPNQKPRKNADDNY